MLFCNKNPSHNKIATCINENCYLRFKLLCMNCDIQSITKSHDPTCRFIETSSKSSFYSQLDFFQNVNYLSKMIKKNKISKLKIDENDIPAETISQILEINECIAMYNRYYNQLLSNLFSFISFQKEIQLRSKSLNILEINKETALMRLQVRNYSTVMKNLNEIVLYKHNNLNENIRQINLKTQFNLLSGFCNDIFSIINHFELQIQGANTWFSEENTKLLKLFYVESNNSQNNNIKPELIKFCFDGFLMGHVVTDQEAHYLKIFTQINEDRFNHYQLKVQLKGSQRIKDFDFSSCEQYFAILQEDGFHLIEYNFNINSEKPYTQKLDLDKIQKKYTLNEKFDQVQFYFRRILLAIQNMNKLVLFNYKKLQVIYEIDSNFQLYFKKEMSMLSEFLLIKSDRSVDIFESNGQLTEIKVDHKMIVKEYYISQNCKYLLLISQKDEENYKTISLYQSSKQLNFQKELMNTKLNNLVKAEFSKDSNYIYLLYDSYFEVIDTYILQLQKERNIFFNNSDLQNPYINFFQTIDGIKIYFIKKDGRVLVTKKIKFNIQ